MLSPPAQIPTLVWALGRGFVFVSLAFVVLRLSRLSRSNARPRALPHLAIASNTCRYGHSHTHGSLSLPRCGSLAGWLCD